MRKNNEGRKVLKENYIFIFVLLIKDQDDEDDVLLFHRRNDEA